MFKKNYTLIVDSENTDKAFKDLFLILNKFANVLKVKDVQGKSGMVTMIEMETSAKKWQVLVGALSKVDLNVYRIGNYWFI